MKEELRGRGSNSISDSGHHNVNEGAVYVHELTGSLVLEIYP
jgi:hypothetical protein